MEKMKIRWTIPTNTEYYAPDDYEGIEEDIRNYIANEERLVRRYVEKYYPNAELVVSQVPELTSANNCPWVETDSDFVMGGDYDFTTEAGVIMHKLIMLTENLINTDGCYSPDFDIDKFISEYENPETEG